jgi:hypothetical protein
MDQPPVDRLLAALFPSRPEDDSPAPEVYAVLDGARDERIHRGRPLTIREVSLV